jgi:uncharacterized membrane protein
MSCLRSVQNNLVRESLMSDATPPTNSPPGFTLDGSPKSMAVIGYGLLLGGAISGGVTAIAALVLAFIKKDEAKGTIWESHLSNIMMTVAIGFAAGLLSLPLMFLGIGFLTMMATAIWVIYRGVLGIVRALEEKPFVPMLPFEPGYMKPIA